MRWPPLVLLLAAATPDSATGWRPTPGVRTFAQQFDHIASNNLEVAAVALRGLKSPPAIRCGRWARWCRISG